jgi:penicillin-binding protein 2
MIASRPVRRYVLGDLAASVLGYVGEIGEQQLNRRRDSGYYPGSLIGRTGIERVCEEHLRGVDGGVLVEVHSLGKPQLKTDYRGGRREQFWVDSLGRRLQADTEHRREPEPGRDVYLTIDRRVQQLAEEALGSAAGAIVVMDIDTGELLALASEPGYDPNVFVGTGNAEQRLALLSEPQHPLLNRAFQAHYAPGSTVKPMVAIAALEEGAVTRATQLECYGSYDLGRRFRCWNRQGHGTIDLVDAIARSCDVFLYQLGERLGPRTVAKYFDMFGLGQPTRIGLLGENRGLVPTPEWKERRFGEVWYRGDTANFSIGQGYMLATPLQLARAYAALANGGRVLQPRLVRSIVADSGDSAVLREAASTRMANVRRESLETVIEGLRKAVEKQTYPTGTGYLAKVEGMDIIGKTGTAQVVAIKRTEQGEEEPDEVRYEFRDHAWFVAVVTDQQPRIVVCVLMEHSGHGGETAAPVAGDLIRKIYAGEEVVEPPVIAASAGTVPADG